MRSPRRWANSSPTATAAVAAAAAAAPRCRERAWLTDPAAAALALAVVAGLFLLLLRQIRHFSLKPESDVPESDLPQWMCDAPCMRSVEWTFNTVRLQLRPYYRQGSLTHDALTAAEGFKRDVESKWRMDPTIVALIVTQLLVATAIGYATAVEVTTDGFVTFIFCAVSHFSLGLLPAPAPAPAPAAVPPPRC